MDSKINQCLLNAVDQVSKENSTVELWLQTKPVLQQKIDNIKNCTSEAEPILYELNNPF